MKVEQGRVYIQSCMSWTSESVSDELEDDE